MQKTPGESEGPWWSSGSSPPLNPHGSLFWGDRRALIGVLLVVVVAATRLMVLPATIWDQDEAYLGLAVVDFDPTYNQPHPPWFPLWVALGKAVAPLAPEPARGLQVLSAVASIWTLFALAALCSIWLRRSLAVAAALLFLFLPGVWFLSGRGYSDTPGTLLLVVSAAWWLRRAPGRGELARGSVAAGLCLLVRPQLAPVVMCLAVWRTVTARGGHRAVILGPLAGIIAVGGVGLAMASGGVSVLIAALQQHLSYHSTGLGDASFAVTDLGLARALIRPELAMVWVALTAAGIGLWCRNRKGVGSPLPTVLGALLPLLLTILLVSNPGHTRYWIPVFALTVGPVVMALTALGPRLTVGVVTAIVGLSLVLGWPQAHAYREDPAPVMKALTWADASVATDGVVVVDRTLRSFATYALATGRLDARVVDDFQLEIGSIAPRDLGPVVAVFSPERGDFVEEAEEWEELTTTLPWVRRIGPDRFLEVTIARSARVRAVGTRW